MMKKPMDLSGKRYGMLTAIELRGQTSSGNGLWFCRCDCGGTAVVAAGNLRRRREGRKSGGGTKSCGCLRKTEPAKSNRRHGMFGTRIYGIWSGMRGRCETPSHTAAKNYRDRGISVCDEWKRFDAFYAWAINNGYDDSLTIDRVNNDTGYCPENCRFISLFDQQSNKRNNVMLDAIGRSQTKAQWCREIGIDSGTLESRLRSGWTVHDALFKPVNKRLSRS